MPEIFQYDFMIRAFLAGLVVAIIAPLIGQFLVARRYSLMSDTLAHVALLGVSIGILLGVNQLWSAVLVTGVAALSIDKLRSSRRLPTESILALVLTGSLALATLVLSLAQGFNANLLNYLFGSIATVSSDDIRIIFILGAVVVILFVLFAKELFASTIDEELAIVSGQPVALLNALLVLLASITVAVALPVVGALLIGALMVIPVLSAMQFGVGFWHTLAFSILISLIAVTAGLFLAFYANLPAGGSIVLVALGLFTFSLAAGRK